MNQISESVPQKMNIDGARRWVVGRSDEGSWLAERLSRTSTDLADAYLTVPLDLSIDHNVDLSQGLMLPLSVANRIALELVGRIIGKGAQTFLVEDDIGRKGDGFLANVGWPIVFLGDRALRWVDVGAVQPKEVVGLLRDGASGYPLIAWAFSGRPEDYGLAPDADLRGPAIEPKLARDIRAIIVSALDAEAFVFLVND